MLTISANPTSSRIGVSRRNFLKIGALGMAGLTLPNILRAEALSGSHNPTKAVIMIHLGGGASHQDMFDMKPSAPSDVRGEFSPIKTNVPGLQICELMPMLAGMMDKFAVIRSIADSDGLHDSLQCTTGKARPGMPVGGWPAIGSCATKLLGAADPSVPPYVVLNSQVRSNEAPECGFLGSAYSPFAALGPARSDMALHGVTVEHLSDRRALLKGLDTFRRQADNSGTMNGLDAFQQQAMGVLTSTKLMDALDITKEPMHIRKRYAADGKPGEYAARMREGEPFLLARRLVEAGARCVSFAWGGWDTHADNFKTLREQLPVLDVRLSALVQDLHDRGLDQDVTVMMCGEFGRSPKINPQAGRDHWQKINQIFLAGGGMKTGQMIGATDRTASEIDSRPVQFGEVFATLYHNLGIDISKTTVSDLTGRPHYLVDGCTPLPELV